MKFAYKLFLAMTSLLMVIFTVFGTWMLSSYFQKLLNREIEQGNTESQMFQYLYEMAYQTMADYGPDFAVRKALENVADQVEQNGVDCIAWKKEGSFLVKPNLPEGELLENLAELTTQMTEDDTYVYGVRRIQSQYFLLSVNVSLVSEDALYLGICKNVNDIYEDRLGMLNQYRLALAGLLLIGGFAVYGLSWYMTRPITWLSQTAGRIAEGDLEKRAQYHEPDEIGELAESFNRMTDRLVEQMQEKERKARQQEDFTAAFAHELKTPLTSIIGYADMLSTIDLSEEERQEAAWYIFSQGKRLESLSHKLLELVSMDRQPAEYRPVQTRLLEENIRETMRPIFQRKGIRGKIVMEKDTLWGDYELLLSLFYNLLDNAVKAVDEDGFILMKGKKQPEGYEVKVVDNGRGIPQEEISRITEAFYMVDKSRSRKEGGAGIGMALCQRIITLHHGVLQIDSKLGEGTVIRLYFPQNQQI